MTHWGRVPLPICRGGDRQAAEEGRAEGMGIVCRLANGLRRQADGCGAAYYRAAFMPEPGVRFALAQQLLGVVLDLDDSVHHFLEFASIRQQPVMEHHHLFLPTESLCHGKVHAVVVRAWVK